jgi:hypothetical protein
VVSGGIARMVLGCRSDVDPPYGPGRTGRHGGGRLRCRPQVNKPAQRPDLRIRRRTQPGQPLANRTETLEQLEHEYTDYGSEG